MGTLSVRFGQSRYDYKVTPGLYCVGTPTSQSPVIVTGNYKLTFDVVRRGLDGTDAWVLVTDTRGINIWCAAGKGLFSTQEVVRSVRDSRLAEVVQHRDMILPQLGSTGVAAHTVKKECGFRVHYGPVRADDLPDYIENNLVADETMRSVTFTLKERAELIPVEFHEFGRALLAIIAIGFVLSGIGPDFFSLSAAWSRGAIFALSTLAGTIAGVVALPLLLPYLPLPAFSAKGALTGGLMALPLMAYASSTVGAAELAAILLWTVASSSYLGMNFTGSTPFTSPTGVEKEMRRALPWQAGATVVGLLIWIAAPFFN